MVELIAVDVFSWEDDKVLSFSWANPIIYTGFFMGKTD
jgi:hypothetical protein